MKKDFPIFKNNPDLIFFDSTASSQKPSMVIDGITDYLENSYSNIHRWMYDVSMRSEKLYKQSKQKVCEVIGGNSYREVIYTMNSTYALNILSQTLRRNKILKTGDKVLLSLAEHHANIVPWLILKEEIGIEVEFVWLDDNFDLDFEDFAQKYDETVKVISFTQVSNVTGTVFDLEKVGTLKKEGTLFIVDASQSVPHIKIDVKKMNCDFLFFTWHKVFADSWIWVLWGKEELLSKYEPIFSWGWAISEVCLTWYKSASLPDKFEPGTPNMTGAVSLLKAFEYIDSIGWYNTIEAHEKILTEYFLKKAKTCSKMKIIGWFNPQNRVAVFSFILEWHHSDDVAEILAENGIAVRSWKHCAHPLLQKYDYTHSVRASLYIYNDVSEIDTFFEAIEEIIKKDS